VTRAYATLGLDARASPAEIRRAYKALVKRWHPDRFASDPSGQAEAAVRMREINAAYRVLRESYVGAASPSAAPSRPAATPGRRLTREEIDAMVRSIGTQGPIDMVIGTLQWYGGLARVPLIVLYLFGVVARTATVLGRRGVAALAWDADLMALLLLGGFYLAWRQLGMPERPRASGPRR
jgi:hypothetical protein